MSSLPPKKGLNPQVAANLGPGVRYQSSCRKTVKPRLVKIVVVKPAMAKKKTKGDSQRATMEELVPTSIIDDTPISKKEKPRDEDDIWICPEDSISTISEGSDGLLGLYGLEKVMEDPTLKTQSKEQLIREGDTVGKVKIKSPVVVISKLESLGTEVSILKDNIKDLQEQLACAAARTVIEKEEIEHRMQGRCDKLHNEIANLEKEASRLKVENETLRSRLPISEVEKKAANQILDITANAIVLKKQKMDAENSLVAAEKEIERLSVENSKLHRALFDFQEKYKAKLHSGAVNAAAERYLKDSEKVAEINSAALGIYYHRYRAELKQDALAKMIADDGEKLIQQKVVIREPQEVIRKEREKEKEALNGERDAKKKIKGENVEASTLKEPASSRSTKEKDAMIGPKIYVSKLSLSTTDNDLNNLMKQFGNVKKVGIFHGKGCGFTEYFDVKDAHKALSNPDNISLVLNGCELRLEKYIDQVTRSKWKEQKLEREWTQKYSQLEEKLKRERSRRRSRSRSRESRKRNRSRSRSPRNKP